MESGPAGRRPVPLDEEGASGSEGEEEEGEVGEQVIHLDANEDGDGDEESYRSFRWYDRIIKEAENIEKIRVFDQVRNLLAAVGSDDEDEDFGALFSQLARSILKAHILKKAKETP